MTRRWQYVVDGRVGEEKGLKLQVLGNIRYSDQNEFLDINPHLHQVPEVSLGSNQVRSLVSE
jgi:hypothetical protein